MASKYISIVVKLKIESPFFNKNFNTVHIIFRVADGFINIVLSRLVLAKGCSISRDFRDFITDILGTKCINIKYQNY